MNYCQLQSEVEKTAKEIIRKFTNSHISLSGAESCTGGAVAAAIVSIANASKIFKGSAVCYCDEAKQNVLSIDEDILKTHFAESLQCAQAMAVNALLLYKSDIAFATTGFLDDNIGQNRPTSLAGKVFISVAKKGSSSTETTVRELQLDVSQPRNYNKTVCVLDILKMILEI